MKNILLVGASGGIGNKVAHVLLEKGHSVFGTYFQHPEHTKNLEKEKLFTPQHLDLQGTESIKKVLDHLEKKGIKLDALINCAGIVEHEGDNLKKDLEIWNKTIAVNLSGNFYLAKIFKNNLNKNGRFIMISSTDSYYGGAIIASYAASKSGVNSLTKSLSLLLSDKKIRVNSIAPGWVMTPMVESNGDEFFKKVADINPLKRNAKPLDVANLINFLISPESDYLNGQVIALEGGYTTQDPTLLLEEEVQE